MWSVKLTDHIVVRAAFSAAARSCYSALIRLLLHLLPLLTHYSTTVSLPVSFLLPVSLCAGGLSRTATMVPARSISDPASIASAPPAATPHQPVINNEVQTVLACNSNSTAFKLISASNPIAVSYTHLTLPTIYSV